MFAFEVTVKELVMEVGPLFCVMLVSEPSCRIIWASALLHKSNATDPRATDALTAILLFIIHIPEFSMLNTRNGALLHDFKIPLRSP